MFVWGEIASCDFLIKHRISELDGGWKILNSSKHYTFFYH